MTTIYSSSIHVSHYSFIHACQLCIHALPADFLSFWKFQILAKNRPLRASASLLHQPLILRLVAPTVDQVTSYTMFYIINQSTTVFVCSHTRMEDLDISHFGAF